jgi:hypothetical protein
MRELALLAALLGVAGWWFFGRETMDERDVRAFYDAQVKAGEALDAPALCAMFAEDYQGEGTVWFEGHSKIVTEDKEKACDSVTDLVGAMHELQNRTGGRLKADSTMTIVSVDIADNGKQATVKVRSTLRLGPMGLSSRTTDTLVRHQGKVQVQASKGISWMGSSR